MIWILLLFYLVGQFGSLWKRATLSADNLHTPWFTAIQYCQGHVGDIAINFALSLGLFVTVWHNTQFLTTMLAWFGFSKDISVPLNPFTAAIYGVFSESLMDLIIAKVSRVLGMIQGTAPTTKP